MVNYKTIICILISFQIVLMNSCKSSGHSAYFSFSDSSNLEGITLTNKGNKTYNFRLSYPVGHFNINENRIAYLKFDLLLHDMNNKLMVYDSIRNMFVTFLDFDNQSKENEIEVEDRKVKVSVDTSFNVSERQIYEVRMKHLYHSKFDPPTLGRDFVFFMSPKGIEGMYISDTEVFVDGVKEKVNAPVGDIFYKRSSSLYQINE